MILKNNIHSRCELPHSKTWAGCLHVYVHICISLFSCLQKSILSSKNNFTLCCPTQKLRPSGFLIPPKIPSSPLSYLYAESWLGPKILFLLTKFSSQNIWHILVLEMPKSTHCWQKTPLLQSYTPLQG